MKHGLKQSFFVGYFDWQQCTDKQAVIKVKVKYMVMYEKRVLHVVCKFARQFNMKSYQHCKAFSSDSDHSKISEVWYSMKAHIDCSIGCKETASTMQKELERRAVKSLQWLSCEVQVPCCACQCCDDNAKIPCLVLNSLGTHFTHAWHCCIHIQNHALCLLLECHSHVYQCIFQLQTKLLLASMCYILLAFSLHWFVCFIFSFSDN